MKSILSALFILTLLACIPLPVFAAEEGAHGGGWGWLETIGRWINLVLLFGLIYYYTKGPIGNYFRDRRDGIQEEMAEAQKARREAEAQLAEMEEKMARLDEELEEIRREAEAEAEKERKRLLSQAEAEAERIVTAAGREVEGSTKSARQELRNYAAELALQLAQERIREELDQKSDEELIERFFLQLTTDSKEASS